MSSSSNRRLRRRNRNRSNYERSIVPIVVDTFSPTQPSNSLDITSVINSGASSSFQSATPQQSRSDVPTETSIQQKVDSSQKYPTSPSQKRKCYVKPHRFQKRRLTSAEWKKKKEVLAKFQCPFGTDCKLINKCFFSHQIDNALIKRLPPYVCVNHLSGSCVMVPFARKNHKKKRCKRGLHLTYDELDNLGQFEEAHSQELRDQMCAVCFEYLSLQNKQIQGFMVNCTHIFCLTCIESCFRTKSECPLCRTVGPFVASKGPLTKKIKEQARKRFQCRRNSIPFINDLQDNVAVFIANDYLGFQDEWIDDLYEDFSTDSDNNFLENDYYGNSDFDFY